MNARQPALDGLRGAAITLVIAGHTLPSTYGVAAPAGVAAFFALSGYLITSILLAEHHRCGTIDLRAFWIRRARRLLPALFVFLSVALTLGYTIDQRFGNAAAAWPAVAYVANLNAAYGFGWLAGSLTPANGLEHLWSLSIEEQFYLLFPLALAALLRRRRLLSVLLGVALLSLGLRLWLYLSTGTSFYVYFRPDTNACLLLIGCAVAVWHRRGGALPTWLGAPALIALLAMGLWPMSAAYSLPLAAGLATIFIATRAAPAWLTLSALTLLGRRSYALYLWHWPALTAWHMLGGSVIAWLACVATAWGIALLSWRFVEEPWLRQGASGLPRRSRPSGPSPATCPTG